MKTAQFTNFSEEEFTGYWSGKGKKFAPGQSLYMPDYLAEHFAKHLVNRELLRRKADGSLVIKDGEKFVSPKHFDLTDPEKMKKVPPKFMELFNKAYAPDELEELGDQRDDVDALINVANKNRAKAKAEAEAKAPAPTDTAPEEKQDPTKPQVITPPDFDDDDDDEASFGEKPVDIAVDTSGTQKDTVATS